MQLQRKSPLRPSGNRAGLGGPACWALFIGLVSASAANLLADFSNLVCQFLFNNFLPHLTALAILMRTTLQASKLSSPLPNQCVQSKQFRFEFGGFTLCAFHFSKLAE